MTRPPRSRVRAQGADPAEVLVLEVGGTSLRAARFDAQRRLLRGRCAASTPNARSHPGDGLQEDVLRAMRALGEQAMGGGRPVIVGVAYPGPCDGHGRVLAAPTVLGPATGVAFDLLAACRRMWPDATVHAMNDLTAAGYRYVAAGLRDFAVVTVGSGIGHKVFLDGRPRVGPRGLGGELGHLRLDPSPDAPPCECGGRGHVGALASGRGTAALLARRAQRDPAGFRASALAGHGAAIDGRAIAAAWAAGDAFTVAGVSEAAGYLGQALAAIHLDTGVERIVIVGGFARALGERYRALLAAAAAAASWDVGQDWNAIVRLGEPDDDSGLLGCGLVAAGLVT